MSYDVSSLFTNVPVDETIDILVERAFNEDWFNKNYGTNLQPTQLRELLQIAVKNQLFQFDGNLYMSKWTAWLWVHPLAHSWQIRL